MPWHNYTCSCSTAGNKYVNLRLKKAAVAARRKRFGIGLTLS
jgi:hypothetical protein